MSKLSTRVRGVNLANKTANEIWPRLVEAFKPFVGYRILTKPGNLVAKCEKAVKKLDLPCNVVVRVYWRRSEHTLTFCVTTCVDEGGRAFYYDAMLNIGDIRDGVLEKLHDLNGYFRTDYTEEEILRKREVFEAAKRAAGEAEGALYPFGEYDR